MRLQELLAVLAAAILGYVIIPIIGAFTIRHSWRVFRRRMEELRSAPLLTYGATAALRQTGEADFRLFGDFDSIGEGEGTLWVRGEGISVPVLLKGAKLYLLPAVGADGSGEESTPQEIRWRQLATLNENAAVFVGGRLSGSTGRFQFETAPDGPLVVIFYDGPAETVLPRSLKAGRQKNEYFNRATPFGIALGVFLELLMALSYLNRPAFSPTVATALTGALLPLLAGIPPGVLFIVLYRIMWRQARSYRAYRDVSRMLLTAAAGGYERILSPGGAVPPGYAAFFPPERAVLSIHEWVCFSPSESRRGDPMLAPCCLPGDPERLSAQFNSRARLSELAAGIFFSAGLSINVVMCLMILYAIA